MWRGPEAHASGPVNKASDIFSFGIVVSRLQNSLPFWGGQYGHANHKVFI